MDYIIEKTTITELGMVTMQPVEKEVFTIKYFKTGIDPEGKEVQVVDENRVEQVSIEQLEQQKISHQNSIKEIDSKIAEMARL